MEFMSKMFGNFVNAIFDESITNKNKHVITEDYCSICDKTCDLKCICRCHFVSCKECDLKLCDFQECTCHCHPREAKLPKSEIKIKINSDSKSSNITQIIENIIKPSEASMLDEEIVSSNKDIKSKLFKTDTIKADQVHNIIKFKSKEGKSKTFYNKLINSRLIDPLLRNSIKDDINIPFTKMSMSNSNNNSNNKKEGSNEKIILNESQTSNRSNSINFKKSYNVDKNPFTLSLIKKKVQKMKFKDLSISTDEKDLKPQDRDIMNNSASMLSSSLGIFDINKDKEPETTKPIPPSNSTDKDHLNYSFDLNNSKLYYGKSSVFKRMEDLQRELIIQKNISKDLQVNNVTKGFESQEAWQMYNSLIFSNPTDLPESSALKKTDKFKNYGLDKNKAKGGNLTSTGRRK
jgi:hypothetical protein